MTSPSILVTGGSGFLGARLASRLSNEGEAVIAPARNELPLDDVAEVTSFLRTYSVDRVVHLAACTDRREEPGAHEDQWRDTFGAGRILATACAQARVRLVVAAGSMDEVGTSEDRVVTPDAPPAPSSTYGLCKTLLLETFRYLAPRSGMQVEWVRPTAIYGPGQTGPMLVPSAFAAAIGQGSAQFTSGMQRRDFVYVDDVIEWLSRAQSMTVTAPTVTVHHLGSGKPISVRSVLQEIGRITGSSFGVGAVPRRPGEPNVVGVPPYSDKRAPLDGWAPTTSLIDGLQLTWQWWKDHA